MAKINIKIVSVGEYDEEDKIRLRELDDEIDNVWDEIDKECDKNENYDKEKYRELRYKESRLMREYNTIMDKYMN